MTKRRNRIHERRLIERERLEIERQRLELEAGRNRVAWAGLLVPVLLAAAPIVAAFVKPG